MVLRIIIISFFIVFSGNIFAASSQIKRFKKVAEFSEIPVMTIKLRAYVYDKNILLPKTKEDLYGMRVTTVRGYSYAGFLKYIDDPANKIRKNAVNHHKSGFLLLQSGRTDIFLDYAHPAKIILKDINEYEFRYNNLFELDIFFALSKQYPDCKAVLTKVMKSYEKINEI